MTGRTGPAFAALAGAIGGWLSAKEAADVIAAYRAEALADAAQKLTERGNAAIKAADAEGGRTTPSDPKYHVAATFFEAAKLISP